MKKTVKTVLALLLALMMLTACAARRSAAGSPRGGRDRQARTHRCTR